MAILSQMSKQYGSVLVVDDINTNILVIKGILRPYEIRFDSAISGLEAIEKVKSGNLYDVIFMDYMMPELDGVETLKQLRCMGYDRPVVAFTSISIGKDIDFFLENGFDDIIPKPVDIREIDVILGKFVYNTKNPDAIADVREHVAQKRYESLKYNNLYRL